MGLRRWDKKKIAKLRKYWLCKTNTEIGEMLGISSQAVSKKGHGLGLPDKRKMSRDASGVWKDVEYEKGNGILAEIEHYGSGLNTIKEAQGREATANIQKIKNNFKLGDALELMDYESAGSTYSMRDMERSIPIKKCGEIVGITDCQLVVQREKYKECFKFVDILSGKTVVEGLNVCQ